MAKPKQLGHLVLRVRDLEASEQWYSEVLGLHTTNKRPGSMIFMSAKEGSSHELALVSVGPDAPGPEESRVGLYHFAWEMESLEDLQELYAHMKAKDVNIGGIGDHGISLGVYLFDPDGNEIEVYYEMSEEHWPEDSDLFSGEFPGKLEPEEVAV
ncbi:MAG: VOC family protein [Chloroflexota bacterium]|nr:VOC family protein [Chloroflexota bacterium]MDE2688290.1 VOC family protein [Chloroflexota bacterium]